MYNDKIFDSVILRIANMCNNNGIINHVKRLLNDVTELIEVSDSLISGKIFDEFFEISISEDYFMIYSTSWTSTTRNKIVYFKNNDRVVLSFDNNEVYLGTCISNNSIYHFKNGDLIYASYLKNVRIDSRICGEVRKIRNNENIEIYRIDDSLALKKINKNGKISCFTTCLYKETIETLMDYGFIGSKMDRPMDYDEFQDKVMKLKRW